MKVGFIGLGNIGAPMAMQVLKGKFDLIVHNRTRAKAEPFAESGAKIAETPTDVAKNCDIVLTCLLTPRQVEEVYLGDNGLFAGSSPGQIFCDTSTIDPVTSKLIGEHANERGVSFFDAPVSGGPMGAEKGALSVMVGGPKAAFEKLLPVLSTFGDTEKILHLGPVGAGATAKICNQMIVGITHAAVSEVFVLGKKAGMEPSKLFEVMMNSSAQSNTLARIYNNFITSRDFTAKFSVHGIMKDLECGIETAKLSGVRTMLAPIAQQLYQEAIGRGYGDQDTAAVIRPMEEIAGIEARNDD